MPIQCSFTGCIRTFKKNNHLTLHPLRNRSLSPEPLRNRSQSPEPNSLSNAPPSPPTTPFSPPPSPLQSPQEKKVYHPHLTGEICNKDGLPLPPGSSPVENEPADNPWAPFDGEAEFRLADQLFRKVEMSQSNIDELMNIWFLHQQQLAHAAGSDEAEGGPFDNHRDMYTTIDDIQAGSAPWRCFQTVVDETLPRNAPEWQKTSYQVWYRDPNTVIANILSNPEFSRDFDVSPYIHTDKFGTRRWCDFMSGNFAWRHATQVYDEDETDTVDGAMLVPVILGADKTTVSVATGHVEYHPLYLTIGNITNSLRRAHANAVIPIGFLAIPKSERKYDNDVSFRMFKKKLYHTSIAAILKTLKPAMTVPVIRKCPDGHFRRVIYDLAAFIADYPEQVLLAGIVQGWCGRCTAPSSNLENASDRRTREMDKLLREEYSGEGRALWDNFGIDEAVIPFTAHFPRADIHEMLSADLLHQVIKGCFKDMLVDWVIDYLTIEHGEARANEIIDDIDRRIALVPAFPGLRRFPHGRRFKQWTGDDSKALMKVFLPAVAEYLPEDMMKCLSSFLDFCYLVRRSDIDENSLQAIKNSIEAFHHYREIFRTSGVREHFSLPRMHSIIHYPFLIIDFGAPNGLCSSITESRHISAVKKPWRRSNRYQALSQMLLTNQRLDKLIAFRSCAVSRGLLPPTRKLPDPSDTDNDDIGPIDSDRAIAKVELAKTRERSYPRYVRQLAEYIGQPRLEPLIQEFLRDQLEESNTELPSIISKINVYHSAVAMFYAPSDNSGIRGMKQERIRSTPSWHGVVRRDCVLATINEDRPGFRGMSVARALLFFSFQHEGKTYPCALVHWFNTFGHRPDPKTSMWIVKPTHTDARQHHPFLAVVHLDTLVRGVHLEPVYGSRPVPANGLKFHHSLDIFHTFYVNKYADYHSNEILF
ncbi:hypothetical protein BT96DRAFT_960446 [Gymnopus androsaceus JB14]|uniref:C2H2-type domain-containing protein n=1 Tax=Gymnopus androsaceus JB14 TaxID=1447944 RepID=A0A6A4GNY0_9AGAR|nr:hypothetical protein BT96DRAFT_960446 [Gymnopus androsaceus JB14]